MSTIAFDQALLSFEPVLGLETHVELGTESKMFCGCATTFGAPPNTHVCPTCLALPGSLPVPNEEAIESTIRIGLALNGTIATWSRFARKNYFYPDMPKNYQISQYEEPLVSNGYLDVEVDGKIFRVEIERVHLEEDTGKSTHVGGATGRIQGADHSIVDYNRAGIPLVEIVTRPITGAGELAPEVARAYGVELREVIRSLGVSDVRMDQGSMRFDVNVSLNRPGEEWGTRTETKNVNSFRSVERAVRGEIERQAYLLTQGERILQETRHFHEDTGVTTPGRSKEEAQDYRYFPDPDLVPIEPDPAWVESLRAELPELPRVRRLRLQEEWSVSTHDMESIYNAGAVDLVEATVAVGAPAADARKWWMGELARRANESGTALADLPITPADVARVTELVAAGSLNDKLARAALEGILAGEGDADAVVAKRGLQIADEGELVSIIDQVLAENADAVAKVRSGKIAAVGALVGGVMKLSRGKADAGRARELILAKLEVSA